MRNYVAGGQVLRILAEAMGEGRRRLAGVRADLDKLDDFIDDVVARRGNALVELAQHYLPDISHDSVSKQFIEVRAELERLLRKKQKHERELQQAWDANLDARSELETQLDQLTHRLDELAAQRDELQKQLAERLKANGEFQELSQQALFAETELKRNEQRVAEIRSEAAEKLPAYEKSGLFKYLHRRGFGAPDYKGRGFTKQLDRWVARVVRYNDNRRSYDFLHVTPELMAAEVDRRRDEFNGLMGRIEAMEDAESDAIGLTGVLRQGNELGDQREQSLAELKYLEATRDHIEREMRRLEQVENEYYVAGVNRLKDYLGSMEESALAARTRSTPETTDDAIFAEIQRLGDQLHTARQQSHSDRQTFEVWQQKISGLDTVVRHYRASEFDSRRSYFSPELNISREVDRFFAGENTADGLWQTIRRHQRFLHPDSNDDWGGMGGVFDSDVSNVLGRVLMEVAGAALRQAVSRGMHRRGHYRQQTRQNSGRPAYRRGGGFTNGRGF